MLTTTTNRVELEIWHRQGRKDVVASFMPDLAIVDVKRIDLDEGMLECDVKLVDNIVFREDTENKDDSTNSKMIEVPPQPTIKVSIFEQRNDGLCRESRSSSTNRHFVCIRPT